MEKVLTNKKTWEDIDPECFKRVRENFPIHMIHFITNYLTNTLPVMQILYLRQNEMSDLCPCFGMAT